MAARRLAIAGLGLIGGSLGLASRQRGWEVVGLDASAQVLARALERGAIDRAVASFDALGKPQLLVLAAPLDRLGAVAATCAPLLEASCVVTDVGSVKAPIVRELQATLGARYVGGHPMFGTSAQGIDAADSGLVPGAPFVLTPTSKTDPAATAAVAQWAKELGMKPIELTPEEHDRQVGALSHLPYLVACALTATAGATDAAGPAFQQMTRVALSPSPLWASILTLNRPVVQALAAQLSAELGRLGALTGVELEQELERLRARREAMFPGSKR